MNYVIALCFEFLTRSHHIYIGKKEFDFHVWFFFFLSFFFPCFWMVVFLSFFSPLFFFSPFFSPVFGNYFFPQFSVFKNNFFVFLRQKTCLVTYFRQKSKIIFNFHFVKETENWSWAVFIFQFSLTLENTPEK